MISGEWSTRASRAPARKAGFRAYGKSKDSRDDLPQVVVGMAVTRDGIPVRVWSWPGSTADSDLIRQVRDDMRAWSLSRIVWVADRGFSSRENRRALMRDAGGYIIGEKLRSGSADVRAALSRQGRYATVKDNLQVKEVNIGSDDRFVLCCNPAQAERDAAIRSELVTQLEEAIKDTDKLGKTGRARLEGSCQRRRASSGSCASRPAGSCARGQEEDHHRGEPGREIPAALLRPAPVSRGRRPGLQAAPRSRARLGDMKQILDLRPACHRREDRIRAHILLCWLVLLLIRVAETSSGWTWARIRAEVSRLHAITFTGPSGTFRQATELTKPQHDLFTALAIDPPRRIQQLAATR